MSISNLWLDVDFGAGFDGEAVGYQFRNTSGTLTGSRVTAGVSDLGNGQYGALVATVPADTAQVRWDTGGGSPIYATEDLGVLTRLVAVEEDYIRDDALTFNASSKLLTARRRVFPDKATADASTAGGAGEGEIATFNVTATHASATQWESLLRVKSV